MKSMSFKNRDEMVKGLKSIKVETTTCDGFNFSRIADEPKCGMDALVEKLHNSRMGLIEDEAEYWEMKAELHFEK